MTTDKKPLALITRPLPEAKQLADFLASLGYDSIIEPMFTLETSDENVAYVSALPKENIQAIVFTSRNAVLAMKDASNLFFVPVLCVGDSTAAYAKHIGFVNAKSARGNIRDLENLIRQTCSPENGKLLYLTGLHIAGHLQESLTKSDYKVERHVVYETKPVPMLSDELQAALQQRQLSLALFYSPRTAKIFEQKLIEYQLVPFASTVDLFCLSRMIAGAFSHVKWLSIHYPELPNTNSLLELVQKFQFNHQSE